MLESHVKMQTEPTPPTIENCLPLLEGQAVLYVAVRCFAFCDRSIGEPALYYKLISSS